MILRAMTALLAGLASVAFSAVSVARQPPATAAQREPIPPGAVKFRVATFDLHDVRTDELLAPRSPRLEQLAAAIRAINPQVIMLSGLAYDMPGAPGFDAKGPPGSNAKRFVEKYVHAADAGGVAAPRYRIFVDQPNSGVPSGYDLNHDGKIVAEYPLTLETPEQTLALAAYSEDCWGPGAFPGQNGLVLLVDERLQIQTNQIRTFRKLPWSYMDAAAMPDAADGKPFFSDSEKAYFRLASVGLWDVPITLPNKSVVHLLCGAAVPPSPPGPAGINPRRNHDEIRFWADYIEDASWIVDDDGQEGGLRRGSEFVILGNFNVDPDRGDRYGEPIKTMLGATRKINLDDVPKAPDASTHTCAAGLRLDYVLPARSVRVMGGGVWRWPEGPSPSDHTPVWMDIAVLGP